MHPYQVERNNNHMVAAVWPQQQQSSVWHSPQYIPGGWNAVPLRSQPVAQQQPQQQRPLYRQSPPPVIRSNPPAKIAQSNPTPRRHVPAEVPPAMKRMERPDDIKSTANTKLLHDLHADDFLSGTEKAIRMDFDPETRQWKKSAVVVRIEEKPFAVGSMRAAYKMEDLTIRTGPNIFVAKVSRDPKTDRSTYFSDVETQTEAKLWAERFNARIGKQATQPVVDFLVAYVAVLVERPGSPVIGVEKMVHGDYVKYNNNWDWSDDRRNTPQAFSHFTWEESGHTILVCDIQGVGNLWTDPQMHSIDGKGYSSGNMGMRGINAFLNNHRCNALCRALKLLPTGIQEPKPDGGTVYRTDAQDLPEADLDSCQTCAQVVAQQLCLSLPTAPHAADADCRAIDFDRVCIKVVGASGLVGVDSRRVPDAMVVVCLGTQTAQTRIVFNSADPVWDELLEMYLPNGSKVENLVCVVFDSSPDSQPAIIGIVRIPLNVLDEADGRHWSLDPPPTTAYLPSRKGASSVEAATSYGKLHLRILCLDSPTEHMRHSTDESNGQSARPAALFPASDNSILAPSYANGCGEGTHLKPSAMLGGFKKLMGWLITGTKNEIGRPINAATAKMRQDQTFLSAIAHVDQGDRYDVRIEIRRVRNLSLPWIQNARSYLTPGSCPPMANVLDLTLCVRLRLGAREASTSPAKIRWGKPKEGGECTWDKTFIFPCSKTSANMLYASLVRLDDRTGGEEVLGKMYLRLFEIQYDGKGIGGGWIPLEGQPEAALFVQVWRPTPRESQIAPRPALPQQPQQQPAPRPPAMPAPHLLDFNSAPPAPAPAPAPFAPEPHPWEIFGRRSSLAPCEPLLLAHGHAASDSVDAPAAAVRPPAQGERASAAGVGRERVSGSGAGGQQQAADWWSVSLSPIQGGGASSSEKAGIGDDSLVAQRQEERIKMQSWETRGQLTAHVLPRPGNVTAGSAGPAGFREREAGMTIMTGGMRGGSSRAPQPPPPSPRGGALVSPRFEGWMGPDGVFMGGREGASAWDKLCLEVDETGERNMYC